MMKKSLLWIAILLMAAGVQAQTVNADQYVFSSGGVDATGTGVNASQTLGEPLVRTTTSGTFSFLQGYQRPEDGVTSVEVPFGPDVQLSIFPNPVGETINLELEGTFNEPIDMQLYDAQGRAVPGFTVEMRHAGKVQRDVSQLASGTYFLRMSQGNGHLLKTLPVIKR